MRSMTDIVSHDGVVIVINVAAGRADSGEKETTRLDSLLAIEFKITRPAYLTCPLSYQLFNIFPIA